MILAVSTFAQNSISDGIRRFDNVLFEKQIQRAETAIGFVYYSDSETCGSVVPWIKNEIKRAAARTMRIKIIDTSSLSSEGQIVATRGVSFGQMKKSSEQKNTLYQALIFQMQKILNCFWI